MRNQNNFEKISILKNDIEKNNNLKSMIELGEIYYNANIFSLAEKYFKMAFKNDSYQGKIKLGKLYLKENRLNLAEKCFKELADNGDSKFQNYLAMVHEKQLRLDLAVKYYELAINNGNENSIFNLGLLYYENKQYDLAIKFGENLDLEDDSKLCISLADIYHEKNDFEKCENYLKLAGDNSTAYYLLALLYKEQNLEVLSEKYFQLGAERDDIDCQIELYKLYESQKKHELVVKNI